jgi:hypothetical protein
MGMDDIEGFIHAQLLPYLSIVHYVPEQLFPIAPAERMTFPVAVRIFVVLHTVRCLVHAINCRINGSVKSNINVTHVSIKLMQPMFQCVLRLIRVNKIIGR